MTTAIQSPTTTQRELSLATLKAWYDLPFFELLSRAHSVHTQYFNSQEVQLSTLLSIKTGKCPEDCKYCPQSAHYDTDVDKEALMAVDEVVSAAKKAKAAGATRFCMGAAWRSPTQGQLDQVATMVGEVKALGLETCVTLGMLDDHQASTLKDAGLDYYNHNLDTSEEYYGEIITTRTYEDRLNTLQSVRDAGINVCCGGIVGLGETVDDRLAMLLTLANLHTPPESVPINQLIPIPGTPLAENATVDEFDFVRIIAVARLAMPTSMIRLSAGRENMTDSLQAWCFFAGANSIFYGETLLTADNPIPKADNDLFQRLNLVGMS